MSSTLLRSVSPPSLNDRLADRGIDKRLDGGLEASPEQHAGRLKRQRRRHATPVGDPAGGQHRCRRNQIDDDRHEGQRRSPTLGTVTTAFGSLGHDDVGADIHRLSGLLKVSDLDDQRHARLTDGLHERTRVSEGQHDGARLVRQRTFDRVDGDRPALESDTPGLFSAQATIGSSRSSQSRSPLPPPSSSSPPPLETAAVKAPPAEPPIGASAIGCCTEKNTVNAAAAPTARCSTTPVAHASLSPRSTG